MSIPPLGINLTLSDIGNNVATQGFVQLALDGTGKKIDTAVTASAAQHRQVLTIGDPSIDAQYALVDVNGALLVKVNNPVAVADATNVISITGASGAAVTATLAAIAGQFHHITSIHITKIFAAANSASATPLVITTTNLNSLNWSFGQPTGVIGSQIDLIYEQNAPIKSAVVNTASTIVCPATTGIIWRINVLYFTA